ncbi:hypothetical protein CP10139811_0414 [Chlamydia ibidis]|uniref:Uncharacterized protein n=2 Tax=Chlamydia ibidis TaxID=1405396 RepID=S7KK31_9CHLA|nr:hypothetical protein CP10139811_0414 [Chlamydia ibidis]EQM62408.1 hypothetical protein H359_0790 [Chlamydia ibidis 10-1398/6]
MEFILGILSLMMIVFGIFTIALHLRFMIQAIKTLKKTSIFLDTVIKKQKCQDN